MTKKEQKREDAQRLLESEIIRAHITELENQLSEIEAKRNELEYLKESISQLKGQKGKEILMPFGSGVLVRGKITDEEKVIVNVGANILVEKNIEDAKKIIDTQIEELNSVAKLIEKEIEKYSIL